jgi:hypothetical protein
LRGDFRGVEGGYYAFDISYAVPTVE